MKRITLPLTRDDTKALRAGDQCLLTGILYTARDAAHKRLCEAPDKGETLPVDLQDITIYFAGPAPAKPGQVIGSAGPTTSYRMDAYSPALIQQGLTAMIGKGRRDASVVEAMKKYGAVYFGATGGCGALIAQRIVKAEVVAYGDLGAEAIHKLYVEDFPVTVIIDAQGHDLYEEGPAAYRRTTSIRPSPPCAKGGGQNL